MKLALDKLRKPQLVEKGLEVFGDKYTKDELEGMTRSEIITLIEAEAPPAQETGKDPKHTGKKVYHKLMRSTYVDAAGKRYKAGDTVEGEVPEAFADMFVRVEV